MVMRHLLNGLKKLKKRRIFIISAGGLQGGLQGLYMAVSGGDWEIISHAFLPFPRKIGELFIRLSTGRNLDGALSDLAWLDYRVSQLFVECIKITVAQLPTSLRTPHFAVLNKPCLWKGTTGETQQQTYWNLPLGDAAFFASSVNIPVISDLVRQNMVAGGPGALPVQTGNHLITASCNGMVILLNIGQLTRMTVIDTSRRETLIDSDTGPGMCCINSVIKDLKTGTIGEEFDRDGSLAAEGTVDGNCLKELSGHDWFEKPAPKQAVPHLFNDLPLAASFTRLKDVDRLATITALTARTIYDFYRREYREKTAPTRVLFSGGGSNNRTLVHYLRTYFDTIPVESIETLGIPVDMRIPLAMGLTVNAHVEGATVPWESGSNPKTPPLGRWVWP